MWYRTSLILFAAGLTGCGALALNSNIEIAQRHDISTGDDTVEIRGSKKGAVERETCHIVRPAFSMALIADAGQVSFIVGCSVVDIVIHTSSDYYSKGQVGVGDINGDGMVDLCIQTEFDMHYFEKTGVNPVAWKHAVIPKPAMTQWLARPTEVFEINADGKNDILGMLIHDETGNLPGDKAAVFWMEYSGAEPTATNWVTHVIKMSDGVNTEKKFRGEKWDHARFYDIDGDGDMDIIGNAEEHYSGSNPDRQTIIGVAWFENQIAPTTGTVEASFGTLSWR